MCLMEKTHGSVSFVQTQALVPGAVGCDLKLMNRHCLLNKVYLNRNAQKTRLWIISLQKPRGQRLAGPKLVFP